jgi:hypothetical protein
MAQILAWPSDWDTQKSAALIRRKHCEKFLTRPAVNLFSDGIAPAY